jgi:hypothetical protein
MFVTSTTILLSPLLSIVAIIEKVLQRWPREKTSYYVLALFVENKIMFLAKFKLLLNFLEVFVKLKCGSTNLTHDTVLNNTAVR